MRKYQQLILFGVAMVCLLGLLLYKKQYEDLKSTFENFNIFGHSEKPNKCIVLNNTSNLKSGFDFPTSSWVKLHQDFYIYSAYWNGAGIAKALGIGLKGDTPVFECHIWNDYRDILFSNTGEFIYNEINIPKSSHNVFEFSCDIGNMKTKGYPYMLVIIFKEEKRFIPIVNYKKANNQSNGSTICVYPDYSGVSKGEIIEFISFHSMIGFTDFILYDVLHYGLLQKINAIASSMKWLNSVNILPWNYPLSINDPTVKVLVNMDCTNRISYKTSFVAIINFEDYIVPLKNKNINYILNNAIPSIVKFKQQTCCTDVIDDRRSEISWPIVLRKTHCTPKDENKVLILKPQHDELNNVSMVSMAMVNTYQSCTPLEKHNAVYDSSTRKFLNRLLQNKFILLWNSGSFFLD